METVIDMFRKLGLRQTLVTRNGYKRVFLLPHVAYFSRFWYSFRHPTEDGRLSRPRRSKQVVIRKTRPFYGLSLVITLRVSTKTRSPPIDGAKRNAATPNMKLMQTFCMSLMVILCQTVAGLLDSVLTGPWCSIQLYFAVFPKWLVMSYPPLPRRTSG